MNTRPTKPELMMGMAFLVSRRSTCRRAHVGCVLSDPHYEHIAFGYNGGYRGGPNDCLRDEAGRCGCVHAETNACIKALPGQKIAFVTTAPCELCAAALVNAHVRHVYYAIEYRDTSGLELLTRAGLEVTQFAPGEVRALNLVFDTDFTAKGYMGPAGWEG